MNREEALELLAATPVTALSIGDTRLRRKLHRAGYDNILEVFELEDDLIDEKFGWEVADSLISLRDRFSSDPVSFAASALPSKSSGQDESTGANSVNSSSQTKEAEHGGTQYDAPSESSRTASAASRPSENSTRRSQTSQSCIAPDASFFKTLQGYQARAQAVFDVLTDRNDTVLVYMAFEEFATELDAIDAAFDDFFSRYGYHMRKAMGLIGEYLPDIFLVYVANRARIDFDGENLWGNFFGRLGIEDGNIQTLFKKQFVSRIEKWKMPLYAKDEKAYYYFYTVLLHGGLSEDSWVSLWEKSLLPMAKQIHENGYGFAGAVDGRVALSMIKNPEGRFAPGASVLNMLAKAPDSTIAPLFDSALRVAEQVSAAGMDADSLTMLVSYGLPDSVMQALQTCMRNRASKRVVGKPGKSGRQSRQEKGETLVYLPEASLQLDLITGTVCISWRKQQFPADFATNLIEYYVDGVQKLVMPFEIDVGKCILEPVNIPVAPQARYDVELRLMASSRDDDAEELGSLAQTFEQSKPHCYEFIKDASGSYHLRGRNERITRPRRVAYVVGNGYRIEPGLGMTPVSEYETSGDWGDSQLLIFDVEPGSSGAVVDASTGEEVAVWQERYSARIDKTHIIGETLEGLDLFGYVPSKLGTNDGLPSVSIEAMDGMAALDDLDISCSCDGERVSLPRHILWQDEYGDAGPARIALVPSETSTIPWHVECCEISARQKSAGGKLVFRYRFAIVPIQDFKPASISIEHGIAISDYQFQTRLSIDIANSQGDVEELRAWDRFSSRMLLRDEFLPLRIHSREYGKTTNARLALAGIDVELPKRLVDISKKRPVCLADALDLGPSAGNVRITSFGWRLNRAVLVMLGQQPLFFKRLARPGEYSFNIFRHTWRFLPTDGDSPADIPLCLSVCYGDDLSEKRPKLAWNDIGLLDCREGFGFKNARVCTISDGSQVLRFDEPIQCGLHLDFKRKATGIVMSEVEVEEGAREVALPREVTRWLDAGKNPLAIAAPVSLFGTIEHEYDTTFTLSR